MQISIHNALRFLIHFKNKQPCCNKTIHRHFLEDARTFISMLRGIYIIVIVEKKEELFVSLQVRQVEMKKT